MYLLTAICAIIISVIVGAVFLPIARRLKYGQTIYEYGPQSHMAKQGIPTMGGIIIIFSSILAMLPAIAARKNNIIIMLIVCSLLFALIGFLDDYIKVVKKSSLGLTAWQKIVLQVLFSIVAAIWMSKIIGTSIYIPFVNRNIELGMWFVPFVTLVLISMSNSSNLLDGIDGLLTSNAIVMFVVFLCILLIAPVSNIVLIETGNIEDIVTFIFVCIGACIGFLRFNIHPAKIIMGDTGSMYLGTCIALLAFVTNTTLFLPLMAFTMLISSLSVIIQVYFFKKTKKRVFKMTPLHHHFELSGMSETQIVLMYTVVQIVMCVFVLYLIVVSVG